jgi:hypothetical protein
LKRKIVESRPVELNESTKKLFQIIYSEQNRKEKIDDDIPKIQVSSLVSRVAFFYEKIRNAVEYEEDHLIRKNAISRILRRQIVIEGVVKESKAKTISKHLLVELIRGGYLPNNTLPETKIKDIAIILEKYIRVKDELSAKMSLTSALKTDINQAKELLKKKNRLIRWLLEVAACEIEENLAPSLVKQVIVNNLFDTLLKNIKLPAELPYEEDLEIQIYLSIGRTYLKMDRDMLSFVLFKYYNNEWAELSDKEVLEAADEQKISNIAERLEKVKGLVEKQLNHPLKKQLDRIVRVYALYYSILSETIESDPVKVYNEVQTDEKKFIANIRKVCSEKYKKAKKRLWKRAGRSIVYIFLTKSIFVFLIELPAVKLFGEAVNWVSLAINISFPAILLFFIVLFMRIPGEDNTDKIVNGIKEISFLGQEKKQPIVLRELTKRNLIASIFFSLIYAASFCFSIYIIVKVLDFLNFNWVSVIIFLFFLAFVSFFSIVVTKGVKELTIIRRKESLLTFLVDLFYMPIIISGKWLSNSFSKINIFIFIFDFILEAPFKILIEVGEDWTKYVRERRESME